MCSSTDRSKTIKNVSDWFFKCVSGNWSFAVCANCSTLYLDPRPIEEDLPIAYGSYYTHEALTKEVKKHEEHVKLKKWLSNTFLNARFGMRLSPSLPLPLPKFVAQLFIQDRVESRFRYFPKLFPAAKVLDVGCGSGKFLRRIRKVGWQAFGVDFDEKAVIEAQNAELNVILGDIFSAHLLSNNFDAISFNHVIEHVPDVRSTLKKAYQLLGPDGFLHLEYPNPEADGLAKYGRFWRGLEAPRHLCIPSRNAITTMLRELGFREVSFCGGNLDAEAVDAASRAAAAKEAGLFIEPDDRSFKGPAFLKVIAWR
jgi:SAM-dependent methyltransferase